MSKKSRRWRRVWLVRILPPVSAGYTNGWEKKSTLRRDDESREVICDETSERGRARRVRGTRLFRRLEHEPDVLLAEPPANLLRSDGHGQDAHGEAQRGLGSIRVRVVGEDGPDEPGWCVELEAPAPMPKEAGDLLRSQLHVIGSEQHLRLSRLEQLAGPEHELNGELRFLHAPHFCDSEAKGYLLARGLGHFEIGEEGVVGEGEAIEAGFHSERRADGQVTRSPSHRLPES